MVTRAHAKSTRADEHERCRSGRNHRCTDRGVIDVLVELSRSTRGAATCAAIALVLMVIAVELLAQLVERLIEHWGKRE